MKVVLVNDTSLYSSHFGCQIIGQVFREQFKRVGIDLILSLPKLFDENSYRKYFDHADLVVINGEGSIHHGRNLHLVDIADRYPAALVNCVYQQNPSSSALKKMLHISARESLSATEIENDGAVCDVVPDMLFASSLLRSFPRESAPALNVGVTDNVVKEYKRVFGIKRKLRADIYAHGHSPGEYLKNLLSFRRVCAGRFHSAVACSVLGIPFSAWESNTWKTKGMLLDAGVSSLYAKTRDEAMERLPMDFPEEMISYREAAYRKIEANFDKIRALGE